MKNKPEKLELPKGLTQVIEDTTGKKTPLSKLLTPKEVWELKKGTRIILIMSHDGVKKIADAAGITTDVEYSVLTQPEFSNNYQYTIQARIVDKAGRATTEIGEANRSNLGPRGRNNPANMAQKRAFDRAVLRHVGITGVLSEDEFVDEEDETNDMKNLLPDEAKAIAVHVNAILKIKTKKELVAFNGQMKKLSSTFNEKQLKNLRTVYLKKLNEFQKTF